MAKAGKRSPAGKPVIEGENSKEICRVPQPRCRRLDNATHKNKPPRLCGGLREKALAMTYSRMRLHTTIGAAAFHFRVRDGIGWFHSAMFTRERVEGRGQFGFWPSCRAHALMGLGRNKVGTTARCVIEAKTT